MRQPVTLCDNIVTSKFLMYLVHLVLSRPTDIFSFASTSKAFWEVFFKVLYYHDQTLYGPLLSRIETS